MEDRKKSGGKTDIIKSDFREPIANIEIQGVDKKDIQINVKDNGIEIKVEKKHEFKKEEKEMFRHERSYSGFYRYFSLPNYADSEKIEANYNNGVLQLKIAKIEKREGAKKKPEKD